MVKRPVTIYVIRVEVWQYLSAVKENILSKLACLKVLQNVCEACQTKMFHRVKL